MLSRSNGSNELYSRCSVDQTAVMSCNLDAQYRSNGDNELYSRCSVDQTAVMSCNLDAQ